MATVVTMLAADDFEMLAERVDRALAAVKTLDADAQAKAQSLRVAVEAFHKAGLTKIVQGLKSDERGHELLLELAAEPSVYALFAMHGLVRADLTTRVNRVIDMARPYIKSHGGDVELAYIEDNIAWVRMQGSCNGCSQTAVTLRNSVEEALRQHVPEILKVEVVPNEPPAAVLVQIGASSSNESDHGWVEGPSTEEIAEAKPFRWDIGDISVLLIKTDGKVQAFRNACAHQGLPLDGGTIDAEARTIACPWHGFRFDCQTGECLTAPQAQLEIFPLRVKDGLIWVRPA